MNLMNAKTCGLCTAITETYRLVKETEHSFCIIIREPLKPGHVMTLPKRHVERLSDLTSEEAKDLLDLTETMAFRIEQVHTTPLVVKHIGKHGSQPHLHFQIIPSEYGARTLFSIAEGMPEYPEATDEYREQLRDLLLE